MPPIPQMYCKEQIYIDHVYTWELKQLEKDVLHFSNAGYEVDRFSLIAFCRDWFMWKHQQELDRIAREEAWRREWSGKKGEVKRLFDEIDADGSGEIDQAELEEALKRLPNFFGFSAEDDLATGGPGYDENGMRDWILDEVGTGNGVKDLFDRLDTDGSGTIDWEEFWQVIGEWLDTGFNRMEEMAAEEALRRRELERLAAEDEARRLAELKAAEDAAAREAARLAEEARIRALSEADRLKAEEEARKNASKDAERARLAALQAEKEEEARKAREAAEAADALNDEDRRARAAERAAADAAAKAEADRLAAEEAARLQAERDAAEKLAADRARWGEAVAAMVGVAEEALARKDPDAVSIITAEALNQLQKGDPGNADHGTVLCRSDEHNGLLRVTSVAGTPPAGLALMMIEENFPQAAGSLAGIIHAAEATDNVERPVADADGVGVAIIVDPYMGKSFAGLVSGGDNGAARVPDEFQKMMGDAMGPLLDRAWRTTMLDALLGVAGDFIRNLCEGDDRISGIEWLEGTEARKDGNKVDKSNSYEFGLGGPLGGTFKVQLKDGAKLNSMMEMMMELTGTMLAELKTDLDPRVMGDGAPKEWVPEGLRGLNIPASKMAMAALPNKLMAHMHKILGEMPLKDLIGELKVRLHPH